MIFLFLSHHLTHIVYAHGPSLIINIFQIFHSFSKQVMKALIRLFLADLGHNRRINTLSGKVIVKNCLNRGLYCKGRICSGSKFFPYSVDSLSEGDWCTGKHTGSHESNALLWSMADKSLGISIHLRTLFLYVFILIVWFQIWRNPHPHIPVKSESLLFIIKTYLFSGSALVVSIRSLFSYLFIFFFFFYSGVL